MTSYNTTLLSLCLLISIAAAFTALSTTSSRQRQQRHATQTREFFAAASQDDTNSPNNDNGANTLQQKVVIIGAGWGGLSTAHALSKSSSSSSLQITIVDAAPRVGGLVRDGFSTINNTVSSSSTAAEAGQHGFWDNYYNIFSLLENDLQSKITSIDEVLTGYAEQGQYSPKGLEAIWPIYRNSIPNLPTGLGQAFYTKFRNLPPFDRATAAPLVLAFSEFDDSPMAWNKYDTISFRDLCIKLGVSKRCYTEAFEPMILTGLFASGAECSAAAALGMAYFFVLRSQTSFDVRWCKGNIGKLIFDPWVELLKENGVRFETSTRVQGFEMEGDCISKVICYTKRTNEYSDWAVQHSMPWFGIVPNLHNIPSFAGLPIFGARAYLLHDYILILCWILRIRQMHVGDLMKE